MPKIAIDISPTNNANAKRGVGFYTSRLVAALQSEVQSNPEFKNYEINLIDSKLKIKSSKFDLIHFPYFDPFQLTLPPRHQTPTIVTVHDLIPRQYKIHYPVGLKGEICWLIQKQRLRQVDYIITDSHTSKYSINQITGYPLDKIYTIYLAADAIFKPLKTLQILSSVRNKYHLPQKFVLYVGDINWNKNIPTLVNSCQQLNYPLCIVGASATQPNVIPHPWNVDLLWLQQRARVDPDLHLLGFVPDSDLVALYNLATLYCQPSFAEGFGLNPLEALQSGCPVAYSAKSSVAEIINHHGEMFDPSSVKSLNKAIRKLWISPRLRQHYRRLGLKYATTFNWQQTAQSTFAVYQLALSK